MMRRMVVGVRDSSSSRAALRWAAERARLTAAELLVVTAVIGPPGPVMIPDFDRYRMAAQRQLRTIVDDALGESERPTIVQRVGWGNPYRVLRELASEADAVVLGSGRHWRSGRLVRRCSRLLGCPVVHSPATLHPLRQADKAHVGSTLHAAHDSPVAGWRRCPIPD